MPKPPAGSPNRVSNQDMDQAMQKVYAGAELEQEVTLSAWECWLILRLLARVQHRGR